MTASNCFTMVKLQSMDRRRKTLFDLILDLASWSSLPNPCTKAYRSKLEKYVLVIIIMIERNVAIID